MYVPFMRSVKLGCNPPSPPPGTMGDELTQTIPRNVRYPSGELKATFGTGLDVLQSSRTGDQAS